LVSSDVVRAALEVKLGATTLLFPISVVVLFMTILCVFIFARFTEGAHHGVFDWSVFAILILGVLFTLALIIFDLSVDTRKRSQPIADYSALMIRPLLPLR
jgi:hypothetical protein